MLWLYNIGIQFYGSIIAIFALFNRKAALFTKGRVNLLKKVGQIIDPTKKHIWFHFASLGEFEQGRPVLEKIKKVYPGKRIVITFFSPSGYEIRKDYPEADGVFYLPLDTSYNANKLIAAFNPEMVIFTKYEYWYHYYNTLSTRQIPIFIISGIFRPGQIYFKWYGGFNRKILSFVSHFFVQNEESKNLLQQINIANVTVSGDTRFDRVSENAQSPKQLEIVARFSKNEKVFIAGSSWPEDEQLISELAKVQSDWKFIIAPHEIDRNHISNIERLFPNSIKFSNAGVENTAQVLIIDNIGLLSSIYQYGNIAYIGGGFGVGIHNTLEAAAFGIPVIFGPNYQRFQEAKDLISIGGAKSISNNAELNNAFKSLTSTPEPGQLAGRYVDEQKGSTEKIFNYLFSRLEQ
ncbi:3-deoxy-D-manno-octulosonic acid transferase [Pedobacter sp. JCM 36344]|uniref:3-deoxy-D-manno-octulosonic acid transferase n=1 Tax=Pedobacter sp. JCM 36344 TaxID=3374280 RepID=UPI003978BC11